MRVAAVAALAGAAAAALPAAGAASAAGAVNPLVSAARLQGNFLLAGRVTVARGVRGERRGQRLTRTWGFASPCPRGQCTTVLLLRQRANGGDGLKLRRTGPGRYRASSTFYVPVRCGRQLVTRGEAVPFTITVRITAAIATDPNTVQATQISATYSSGRRRNLTPCVAVAGRDAATYRGSLVPPSPPPT